MAGCSIPNFNVSKSPRAAVFRRSSSVSVCASATFSAKAERRNNVVYPDPRSMTVRGRAMRVKAYSNVATCSVPEPGAYGLKARSAIFTSRLLGTIFRETTPVQHSGRRRGRSGQLFSPELRKMSEHGADFRNYSSFKEAGGQVNPRIMIPVRIWPLNGNLIVAEA